MDDAELDAFTGRVRAHRRRKTMAKGVGVAIGLFGLIPAYLVASLFSFDGDFSGRIFWLGWIGMLFLGGLAWRFLEPKQHVDEIERRAPSQPVQAVRRQRGRLEGASQSPVRAGKFSVLVDRSGASRTYSQCEPPCRPKQPTRPPRSPTRSSICSRRRSSGDPAALRTLVEGVAPEVARVVRAIVGPRAPQLDDLTQEALMGFIRALPSFRRNCSLRRFASRIAARSAVSACRSAARKASHHRRWVDAERRLPPTGPTSPAHQALADRRLTLLRQLLAELPDAQAEALVLRVVVEHSVSEIAEATGAPVNTVRSRVRLAKEALRRRIEADESLRDRLGDGS